ncbi:hypothetical protein BKA62DRAFT_654619 [Auriculariales sp. MPI-PUGE-AT-0066]|nr:hypothetical protein BKA62DRAFT_654619 [Auriculariales sp. MPI-PUGE-AT-0066]
MAAPQKWDCGVLESNSNFFYQDSAVLIKVGGRDFRVSRSRLAAVSPQFQQAFQFAGAHPDSEPVELHNDPEDFEYFLWFVHVNPLQLEQYNARVSKPEKFRHWLGIAVIAHMYEASDISESCVTKIFAALERADRAFSVEPFMMCKLYRLTIRHAEPVSAGSLSLLDRTRRIWADLLYASKDPVQWLLAARAPEVEDTYLQALAYYYIYSKGPKSEDARLTGEDGQRLLIGAFNLAGQGHHPHNQTGVRPLFRHASPLSHTAADL